MCNCKQKNTQPTPQVRVVEEVVVEDKQENTEQNVESQETEGSNN